VQKWSLKSQNPQIPQLLSNFPRFLVFWEFPNLKFQFPICYRISLDLRNFPRSGTTANCHCQLPGSSCSALLVPPLLASFAVARLLEPVARRTGLSSYPTRQTNPIQSSTGPTEIRLVLNHSCLCRLAIHSGMHVYEHCLRASPYLLRQCALIAF
jgi:hypothetical protein